MAVCEYCEYKVGVLCPDGVVRDTERTVRTQLQLTLPTLKKGEPIWGYRLLREHIDPRDVLLLRLGCSKQMRVRSPPIRLPFATEQEDQGENCEEYAHMIWL